MHAPNQLTALQKAVWEPDTLDYQGLCSGSALRETWGMQRDLGLTAEQIDFEYQHRLFRRNTPEYKILVNARARERYAIHRERLTDWYVKTIERSRVSSAEYRKTEAGQATKRRYNKSEKGKATSEAYSQTDKVKKAVREYASKPEVKAYRKTYLADYAKRPVERENANQRSREFRAR